MLAHRQRRWVNIKQALGQRGVFAGYKVNPLTAGVAYIRFFIFISTLRITF